MPHVEDGGAPRRLPLSPLRVWRVDAGASAIVRILSSPPGKRIRGCLTHYVRRKSHLCLRGDCPRPLHATGSYWKGYLAAERYDQDAELWIPVAFEVSEHLELDFRYTVDRGQVWSVERLPKLKDRHFPVVGTLLEERDPGTFPAAFDLHPTLQHLYHADAVVLDVLNPLPDRTMVRPSQGAPPAVIKAGSQPAQPEPSPTDRQTANELLREYLHQRRNGGNWIPRAGEAKAPDKVTGNGNGRH